MKSLIKPTVLWGSVSAVALLGAAWFITVNLSLPTNDPHIALHPTTTYIASYTELHDGKVKSIQEYALAKEQVYALTVDNRLTYYFDTIEAIEATLTEVLQASINHQFEADVTVSSDMAATVTFIQHPTLSAEGNTLTLTGSTLESVDDDVKAEILPNHHPLPESPIESTLPKGVTAFDFQQSISITTVTKTGQPMTTPKAVATDLLKTNVTPASYTVSSGDSPSTIAENNNMSLTELFTLNEGLEQKSRSLQIGEDLVVEKLVPELCVVIESIEYTSVSISNDTVYKDDNTVYKGLKVVADAGYNGIKRLTESIETVNGDVINRQTITEEIISPPKPKIILVGTKPIPDTGSVGFFISPLKSYRLTSSYGPRWGRNHNGLDMAVSTGTSVKAADGGTVVYSGWNGGYGYMVEIDHHNGMVSRYAHNSKLLVEVGQEVGQGQVISKSGNTGSSTGPHLHFEITKYGEYVDPTDYFN